MMLQQPSKVDEEDDGKDKDFDAEDGWHRLKAYFLAQYLWKYSKRSFVLTA